MAKKSGKNMTVRIHPERYEAIVLMLGSSLDAGRGAC